MSTDGGLSSSSAIRLVNDAEFRLLNGKLDDLKADFGKLERAVNEDTLKVEKAVGDLAAIVRAEHDRVIVLGNNQDHQDKAIGRAFVEINALQKATQDLPQIRETRDLVVKWGVGLLGAIILVAVMAALTIKT